MPIDNIFLTSKLNTKMKTNYFLLGIIILCTISCDPNTMGTCDLQQYQGQDFVGTVLTCNADPSQSEHFTANSHVSVLDSLLIIEISNIDILFPFSFSDTFQTECIHVENYIRHNIRDFETNAKLGGIGIDNGILSIVFEFPPCPETTTFEGVLKK